MPKLVINPGSESVWEIRLKPGSNLIGRAITNDVQIRDPSVSGTHCEMFVSGRSAHIKDLASTNGTYLDGARVTEASLEAGCKIRLGDVELLYQADSAEHVDQRAAIAASPALPLADIEPAVTLAFAGETQAVPTRIAGLAELSGRGGARAELGCLRALQHCRFHPRMPARFVCSQCGHYFCDACVARRGGGGGTQNFCRHCGIPCASVEVQYEAVAEKGFFARLPDALLYPVRGAGVIIVIVGIILVGLVKAGEALFRWGTIRTIIFGTILEIFAGGYLFSYLQGIAHSTVAEDRELPDLPGISNLLEDVIIPFFRFLGLTLFCFTPAIAAGIWYGGNRSPMASYVFVGSAAFGYLYFPMAFLAVAILDSIWGGNPLLVMPSILKVPLKYIVCLAPLATMSAVQWFGSSLLDRFFPERWTTHDMGQFLAMVAVMGLLGFFSLYLLVLSVHLLGLIFVTSKEKLGWIQHSPHP